MSDNAAFYLLRNSEGQYLNGESDTLTLCAQAGDGCCWVLDGDKLKCATSNMLFYPETDGEFIRQEGPTRLPSEHLIELRANGLTVLENVLDSAAIASLGKLAAGERARHHGAESPYDGYFWMMSGLSWSVDLARAVTHPVALWLLQELLDTHDIHFCHQPIITTLKPARKLKGTFPAEGWHSDYPYHPGVFPNEFWPASPVLGAQFNVCLDDFEPGNAGTQYVPGSHKLCKTPPLEFNLGGTHMGEGVHRRVQQMTAPAGAAPSGSE
ncbi:MAG: phytanoyl-CoA dioxygenase family protein [Chloroflexi bacterium]|nr:phytanoyl-CoA dioxygenase family protein [Chloroflexota bacterium]